MREIINLPSIIKKPSDRERRYEIRRMREKIVRQPVVDLKTFKGLKNIDATLSEKIKLADNQKTKTKGEGPKEPA